MSTFRVYVESVSKYDAVQRFQVEIEAETPEDAAKTVRKQYPGARITKVKVNRSR